MRSAVEGDRGVAHAMFATGNSQLGFSTLWCHRGRALVRRRRFPHGRVRGRRSRPQGRLPALDTGAHRRPRPPRAAHYLDGLGPPQAQCDLYTELLAAYPLDLCCLGIGENGHLAFNDPPVADFDDPLVVKVVELEPACRLQQVNEGHFATLDGPGQAMTVTIPALLRATTVLAIVPEARKRNRSPPALTGP